MMCILGIMCNYQLDEEKSRTGDAITAAAPAVASPVPLSSPHPFCLIDVKVRSQLGVRCTYLLATLSSAAAVDAPPTAASSELQLAWVLPRAPWHVPLQGRRALATVLTGVFPGRGGDRSTRIAEAIYDTGGHGCSTGVKGKCALRSRRRGRGRFPPSDRRCRGSGRQVVSAWMHVASCGGRTFTM